MTWKRSFILISSIFLVIPFGQWVQACAGGDDPYDYFPSFFANDISKEPAYVPFCYTSLLTYYDEPEYYGGDESLDKLPDANIPEWYHYIKQAAAEADIDSFIYTYSKATVENIYDHAGKGTALNIPADASANSFAKWLMQRENGPALKYLLFAKQCEPYTRPLEGHYDRTTSDWVYEKRNSTAMQRLVTQGQDVLGSVKGDFLKWRYYYQVLRMAFYSGNYTQTIQLYDALAGTQTAENIMYPRCLSLKAGALFKTGRKTEAAYLYSRVFDLGDEGKRRAYVSFNWATEGKIDGVLKLCANDHERAVLYVMDGLYEAAGQEKEGLEVMEKAYALDPAIHGLNIIMTREINKAEERYLEKQQMLQQNLSAGMGYYSTTYYTSDDDRKNWPVVMRDYLSYFDRLNAFAQKMAKENKNTSTAYWQLASAYIYFLQNKPGDCKKYLDLAAGNKMTDREHDVHDVINALYIVKSHGTLTQQTEEELLPSLKWIEQRSGKEDRFRRVYRDLMNTVIATAYLQQKDTVKALYALARSTYTVADDYTDIPGTLLEHMGTGKLHEVQAFITGSKTPYEQWLVHNASYTIDALHELEGTKYIRQHEFDKAVAVLEKVSATELEKQTLPDVLVSHLQDSQDWNSSDSGTLYNKLTFARKMVELQQALDKNPKDGRAAYQYANALYNMSYYGKAHHAYDYYRSSVDDNAYYNFNNRRELPAYAQDYYSASQAEKYYLLAFANTSDPEVKARCLFLAARCREKSCPVPAGKKDRYEVDDKLYYTNCLKNPYFKQLKDGYKSTKFYSSAYSTCSYLRDYAGRK